MGMNLYIKSGEEPALKKLARDPDALMAASVPNLANALSAAEFPGDFDFSEALEQHMASVDAMFKGKGLRGWIMKFFLKRQMRTAQTQLAEQMRRMKDGGSMRLDDDDRALDLHKSWHALHFLLSGSAWEGAGPAGTLLAGGKPVGEDLGYGPARVVSAADTAAFSQFLADKTQDELTSRIDMEAMSKQQIYCADGDNEDPEELAEFVGHYFEQLKGYVAAAAGRGHGLAIWMA